MVGHVALILGACLHQVGSVSQDAVLEMLESPALAVTPFQPAWLNEGNEQIWRLKKADRALVCAILRAGEPRRVPELAYQTDDEHAPITQNRFYIYATNAQCLAATVVGDRVMMHDIVLPPEQEQLLYQTLKPYLARVFSAEK